MKIQVISDVHTEFHKDGGKKFWEDMPVTGDILVIAGDLGTHKYITQNLVWAGEKFPNVVYVTGNHEYWGAFGYKLVKAAIDAAIVKCPNVHWLFDSAVTIDGQRFIGNTMWFRGDGKAQLFEHSWSDFKRIPQGRRWIYKANTVTRFFLGENLQENDVMVTHHLPCWQSVHPRFVGTRSDWQNEFYVCDMSELILDKKPRLCIHGHTHDHNDYVIGDTRIVSNPYGYQGHERVQDCNLGFCVDI